MSITYIGPDKENPRATKLNINGVVTSERHLLFSASDPSDNESHIIVHANCPQIGQPHPDVPQMWCVDINVSNFAPYSGWRVTSHYSSEREFSADPYSDPAIIGPWDSDSYQEVAEVDQNDKPILNSAGDPYDPPLMKDFSRRNVTVRKNVPAVPEWFLDYEDAVNSDTFTVGGLTVPVGKALCKKTQISELKFRNGYGYYEVTTVIQFAKKGWKRRVLDAGFREKLTVGNVVTRVKIKRANDEGEMEYIAAPVPLDGAGRALDDPTLDNAVYNEHELYESKPFAILPLA